MLSFLNLIDAVEVKKCPAQYIGGLEVSVRMPSGDVFAWFLERAKGIKDVYGRVCFLYNALKRYFGIDLQRYYGKGSRDGDFWSLLCYCYFLIQQKGRVMQENEKLLKDAEIVGCVVDKSVIAQTPLEDWIDNYDVMKMLHISRRTLQTLRSNGKVRFSKIGRKIYYRRQDIQNMLAENYTMFEIHNEYGKKREKKTA